MHPPWSGSQVQAEPPTDAQAPRRLRLLGAGQRSAMGIPDQGPLGLRGSEWAAWQAQALWKSWAEGGLPGSRCWKALLSAGSTES